MLGFKLNALAMDAMRWSKKPLSGESFQNGTILANSTRKLHIQHEQTALEPYPVMNYADS